LPWC